jgi:hypothetical protein
LATVAAQKRPPLDASGASWPAGQVGRRRGHAYRLTLSPGPPAGQLSDMYRNKRCQRDGIPARACSACVCSVNTRARVSHMSPDGRLKLVASVRDGGGGGRRPTTATTATIKTLQHTRTHTHTHIAARQERFANDICTSGRLQTKRPSARRPHPSAHGRQCL